MGYEAAEGFSKDEIHEKSLRPSSSSSEDSGSDEWSDDEGGSGAEAGEEDVQRRVAAVRGGLGERHAPFAGVFPVENQGDAVKGAHAGGQGLLAEHERLKWMK